MIRGQTLAYCRKFVPILGQSGHTLHFRCIEHQHHEDLFGNIPFALDSVFARWSESESRIVLRVAHNNDEWIARIFDFLIRRVDQSSTNSLSLMFRKNCHRAQDRKSTRLNSSHMSISYA